MLPDVQWIFSPLWSPDSSLIAFEAITFKDDEYNSYIITMNADGSNMTIVADNGYSPTFSPDGMKIAYIYNNSDHTGSIMMINKDGSDLTTVLTSSEYLQSIDWSKYGIVFTWNGPFNQYIKIINEDGTGEKLLAEGEVINLIP